MKQKLHHLSGENSEARLLLGDRIEFLVRLFAQTCSRDLAGDAGGGSRPLTLF